MNAETDPRFLAEPEPAPAKKSKAAAAEDKPKRTKEPIVFEEGEKDELARKLSETLKEKLIARDKGASVLRIWQARIPRGVNIAYPLNVPVT